MKKYLLILLSIFSINLMANTYIYKGTSSYHSDIRFTWDGKYLYKGTSQYRSDVILSYDGENIYKGTSTYRSDILLSLGWAKLILRYIAIQKRYPVFLRRGICV